MNKDQWISCFVASWLSARAAAEYADYCFRGVSGKMADPEYHLTEDAIRIAEAAWKSFENHGKKYAVGDSLNLHFHYDKDMYGQ